MTFRALIFLNDSPTALLRKGEILKGYFNPNDVFTHIDFVVSVEGASDLEALKEMSGKANVRVNYLGLRHPSILWSLGWSRPWLKKMADSITKSEWYQKPDVIRAVNPFIEAGIATALAKGVGIPIVVSIHGTYDRDPIRPGNIMDIFVNPFRMKLVRWVLRSATRVVGVYEDATNSAARLGAKAPITIYNELGITTEIRGKSHVSTNGMLKVACINRQDRMKDPRNIIMAIVKFPDIHFTLVGDGPIHSEIEKLIFDLHLTGRVECIKAMPNEDWLRILSTVDLYVSNCRYAGISKGVLEAALLGIPIVVNSISQSPPEYSSDWVTTCEDSLEGYSEAILRLGEDLILRDLMSSRAYDFGVKNFRPSEMRAKWEEVYRSLIAMRE